MDKETSGNDEEKDQGAGNIVGGGSGSSLGTGVDFGGRALDEKRDWHRYAKQQNQKRDNEGSAILSVSSSTFAFNSVPLGNGAAVWSDGDGYWCDAGLNYALQNNARNDEGAGGDTVDVGENEGCNGVFDAKGKTCAEFPPLDYDRLEGLDEKTGGAIRALTSGAPTLSQGPSPSALPTHASSASPKRRPSTPPSELPTEPPTLSPSGSSTARPADPPTQLPTHIPTMKPSAARTTNPSYLPTNSPTIRHSAAPSASPSDILSTNPLTEPSVLPTARSSAVPSAPPKFKPSTIPSNPPSAYPSELPTITRNSSLFTAGSVIPSRKPSVVPTLSSMPIYVCDIDSKARQAAIFSQLEEVSPRNKLLLGEQTLEGRALEWLVFQDGLYIYQDDNNVKQRYVMYIFYQSTDGDNWISCSANPDMTECQPKERWLSDSHECEWKGVLCNRYKQVTGIAIEENNLGGTLPDEIAVLYYLEILALEKGRLSGTIPAVLGKLSKLRLLDLDYNQLYGTIPSELLGASRLTTLDLNNNPYVRGRIDIIAGFPKLDYLQLHDTGVDGPIPEELGALKELGQLNPVIKTFHDGFAAKSYFYTPLL